MQRILCAPAPAQLQKLEGDVWCSLKSLFQHQGDNKPRGVGLDDSPVRTPESRLKIGRTRQAGTDDNYADGLAAEGALPEAAVDSVGLNHAEGSLPAAVVDSVRLSQSDSESGSGTSPDRHSCALALAGSSRQAPARASATAWNSL